tara:strand:+ start:174 stop:1007 length:834 start_codon:yes stop_codon:yes gene_type:complete
LNVDVNMQPILLSAIFFGFAISYSKFYKAVSISEALYDFVLAVAVSYLFLIFVYKLFSKFLYYKNSEMIKNNNPTNYFLIIATAVLSNGSILFLDLMNFDLKFKRSYKPFLKEGWRSGGGYETTYRSALLVSLILFSAIVSIVHSYYESAVTYYLMHILIWNLIWAAIPISAIFSALFIIPGSLGLPGSVQLLKNTRMFVPETGGTKMLFANRRMWIFFGTLSFIWGIGLLMNTNLMGLFMFSLLAAIVMLLLLLILWDFRGNSKSKFFVGKKNVLK